MQNLEIQRALIAFLKDVKSITGKATDNVYPIAISKLTEGECEYQIRQITMNIREARISLAYSTDDLALSDTPKSITYIIFLFDRIIEVWHNYGTKKVVSEMFEINQA